MFQRSKQCIEKLCRPVAGLILFVLLASGLPLITVSSVSAADDPSNTNICTDTNGDKKIDIKDLDPQKPCQFSDKVESTPDGAAKTCTGGDCSGLIKNYVNPFIRLLSGLIGVIVAISLIWAGILYSSAGGDPGRVSAAKTRIYNSILALIAYLFLFAFLQWLIPGGIV